jgi:hypothetical protein
MFEIRGLDEAIRKLGRLQNNARALSGSHEMGASEFFTPAFMTRYTRVPTFDALIAAGGFRVASQADFDAIPDTERDRVVRSHTSFSSWREMQEKAAEEYASKQLMKGV